MNWVIIFNCSIFLLNLFWVMNVKYYNYVCVYNAYMYYKFLNYVFENHIIKIPWMIINQIIPSYLKVYWIHLFYSCIIYTFSWLWSLYLRIQLLSPIICIIFLQCDPSPYLIQTKWSQIVSIIFFLLNLQLSLVMLNSLPIRVIWFRLVYSLFLLLFQLFVSSSLDYEICVI